MRDTSLSFFKTAKDVAMGEDHNSMLTNYHSTANNFFKESTDSAHGDDFSGSKGGLRRGSDSMFAFRMETDDAFGASSASELFL
jgi:hypothetical protein